MHPRDEWLHLNDRFGGNHMDLQIRRTNVMELYVIFDFKRCSDFLYHCCFNFHNNTALFRSLLTLTFKF